MVDEWLTGQAMANSVRQSPSRGALHGLALAAFIVLVLSPASHAHAAPPHASADAWRILIHGLVRSPRAVGIRDLAPYAVRGDRSPDVPACAHGTPRLVVPLATVLRATGVLPRATSVLVRSRADRSRESIAFRLEDLERAHALLVVLARAPTPRDPPVRLLVAQGDVYTCASLDWVSDLEIVDERSPTPSASFEMEIVLRTTSEPQPALTSRGDAGAPIAPRATSGAVARV